MADISQPLDQKDGFAKKCFLGLNKSKIMTFPTYTEKSSELETAKLPHQMNKQQTN